MRCGRGVLVRIFRPPFSANPLTTLAGVGEKCGAENEGSAPRHFEHLCHASENLLPQTHTVPTSHSKPRRTSKRGVRTPIVGIHHLATNASRPPATSSARQPSQLEG